jgi:hypothetical protein
MSLPAVTLSNKLPGHVQILKHFEVFQLKPLLFLVDLNSCNQVTPAHTNYHTQSSEIDFPAFCVLPETILTIKVYRLTDSNAFQ